MSSEKSINWLTVGANIRRYRDAKGITQKQLGQTLGVSSSRVSQIESGTKHPSSQQIYAIANRLDVTMDELARDLTAAERARLLLGVDLPLVVGQLEELLASLEKARASAKAIQAELGLGGRLAQLSGHPEARVFIEMMSNDGFAVTHEVTEDGEHTIKALEQGTGETHSATHADLYSAICEVARATGFNLEDR